MANYKKSFNFRNGVQVDDSNFIVNANGLVGIGTSIPTEFLDVRGNIVSSGVVTTKNVYATGVSTFKDNVLIGSGVTVFSSLGIVSATSFRGDGSFLDNISGSKWRVDAVAGLTTTSDVGIGTTDPRYRFQVGQDPTPPVGTNEGGVGIDSTGQAYFTGIVTSNGGYATIGFVTAGNLTITGVSTFEGAIDANGTLDVDGDTQLDDLNVSGVATFSSGVDINGSLDVDGDLQVDDLNVSGVATFSNTVDINSGVTISSTLDVDGQTDLDVLNVAEVATFTGNIDANGTLDVDGDTQLDDLNVAGVATFSSAIDGNGGANITGGTTLDQLNISGVSTLTGIVTTGSDLYVGGDLYISDDLKFDAAELRAITVSGASTFTGAIDANGTLDVDGDTQLDDLNVAGVATFSSTVDINSGVTISSTLDVDGDTQVDDFNVSGVATFSNNIDANGTLDVDGDTQLDDLNVAGVATFSSAIDANEYVNINTNLYVAGISTFYNTLYARELLEAKVGSGISAYNEFRVASFDSGTSGLSSYYGAIKYGNESGGAPYSSRKSLDLINYDSGNVNFYVNANNLSDENHTTGNFHWHRGFNNDRLMTITGIGGSVGIAKTQPEAQLDVFGTGKFSGAVTISNDLTVTGDFSVGGSASFDLTGDLTGSVLGTLGVNTSFINTLVTAGVSTFHRLEIPLNRGGIGIGTTTNENLLCCNNTQSDRVFIDENGAIGIGTDLTIGTGDASTNGSNLGVFLNKDVRTTKSISVGNTARCAVDFSDAVNCGTEGGGVPYLRSEFGYMIPPRVTTAQRNAFKDMHSLSTTLLDGSLIYNTNTERLEMYKGGGWCGIATVV